MVADDAYATRRPSPPPDSDPHATRAGPTPAVAVPAPGGGIIGNYVVEREIGRGGMGIVYLATHSQLRDRRYAVKLMSAGLASASAVARFRREVEAVGKSRHKNLLYAIDAGFHDGNPYLVTEFVEGSDLARILRAHGPLPIATACEIGRQMAVGLDFAHASGIVHRDIKPQNVIVQPTGLVKILDLGLAAVRDANAASAAGDEVVGTPPYMPPEQWRGDETVTAAADIYSLGCTLFEMIAGRLPFPVAEYPDVAAQRRAHLDLPRPRLATVTPGVPLDVAQLVDACLDRHPDRRPRSCRDVAAVLDAHAAPIDATALFKGDAGSISAGTANAAEFDAFIDEPRAPDTSVARLQFLGVFVVSLLFAIGGLTGAYYGPGRTQAWQLRFDRLGVPENPVGIGYMIEAARAVLFLSLVFGVAYLRFRLPLQRLLSPKLNTLRVWVARIIFAATTTVFLGVEFQRQWFAENAATDMVAWAAERGIETIATLEVVPYRRYFAYSLVHYLFIFGGLLVLPILQFVLADLRYVRRVMKLFAAAQRAEPNAMQAVDRLYAVARVFRRLAARSVDTAGVLAIGVQYEFWIGRWTLSEKGYLIEVAGMLVTAGMMILILGYIASQYAEAIEITATSRGGQLDHRIEQRLEQFSVFWFLRSAVLSRPGGIALVSLVFLPFVLGRRAAF